jgi:hypothetical protein
MVPSSEHDPLAVLADDFLARHRRGERPAPEEYAERHPEFAAQIRELFATLLVVENLGEARAPAPGAPVPRRLGKYCIVRQLGRGGMGVRRLLRRRRLPPLRRQSQDRLPVAHPRRR